MLITQCPDCHSLFRVSQGQLKLAEGKVRCGACLRVFDATENALEKTRQPATQESTSPQTVGEQTEMATRSIGSHAAAESHQSTARVVQFPERQQAAEALAEQALKTQPEDQPEAKVDRPSQKPIENEQPKPRPKLDAIPELNIAVEPLILKSDMSDETSPGAVLFWMFATLLAIAVMLAQYLWFERASLASQSNLAGIYQLACEQLPCQLRGIEGLKTLNPEQMIARPHQMFADLISLSIKLQNAAAFEQPYPALEISFTDLKGDLVTRRTFQPVDYLPAYQLGSALPAGLDLEINLPLTDPGERAVGYTIELRQAR